MFEIFEHLPYISQPFLCGYWKEKLGAQWLSGRVLNPRPKGRGFQPHRCHCVVSLSKNINPSLVLVQPRKTCPFITERLLMGRKESNQTAISMWLLEREVAHLLTSILLSRPIAVGWPVTHNPTRCRLSCLVKTKLNVLFMG